MCPLQTADAVLGKLVRESPIAIAVSAFADGMIFDVNDSFLRLFGYSRDEVIGRSSTELDMWFDPDLRNELTAKLEAGQALRDFESTVRTKRGEARRVLVTVSLVEVDGRRCLLSQLNDITSYWENDIRYRTLVEQLPVITYVHGLDEPKTLTYISPQLETILGYSPDAFIGAGPEALLDAVHPEDRQLIVDAADRTLRTLRPYRVEYRVRTADGRWKWFQDQSSVVGYPKGHPSHWQGVLIDITARKLAEESLLNAEAQFRALFEESPEAILVADGEGNYVDANPAALVLLGYERDELLRLRIADVVALEPSWTGQEFARYLEEGHWRGELDLCVKDGTLVTVEAWAVIIAGPAGSLYVSFLRDLTERRERETAQARLAALVRSSPDAVVSVSNDEIITDWNPAAERLFGYRPEEVIGRPVAMLTPPDRAAEVPAVLARLREGATIADFETARQRKDGQLVDIALSAAPVRDSAGKVIGSSRILRDITERKEAEAALRRNEERFRALVQKSSDIILVLDAAGNRKYVSPAVERWLGYRPEELVGRGPGDIVHSDDIEALRQAVAACVEGAQETPVLNLRIRHKDGSWRDFEAVGTNLLGEPSVAGIVLNSRDVTAWKAAQAALRTSEELFRNAFDHAPIGMALIAPDGRFLRVNRSLCELVGYATEDLLAMTCQDITHPDDVADSLPLERRFWKGSIESYQVEKRYLHKDGRIVWILLTASLVGDGGATGYAIAHVLDITERRRLEMDRAIMLASEREYAKQLRQLTEMRADLTAMVAHELRGPVAAIRMMTHLLADRELPPANKAEMFNGIKGEIAKLDRLISDMAQVTDAERDDLSVQLHAVPLAVLMEHAAVIARTALDDHPFSTPKVPGVRVWCDPERIGQVLHNLLDNVAKHTPPGTPVELRAVRTGPRVRIEVADRGPGISAEEVGLIFDKFGRGWQSAILQKPGAGLGLYLARELVRAHGSELTLKSTPGEGAVFGFDLEIAP
jgi:PAS domain S-box-containing protein